jgi:hypothetical protein
LFTTASGSSDHAEGQLTVANSGGSAPGAAHAEGCGTVASATASSTSGEGSFALYEGQIAHASGPFDGTTLPTAITCKQTSDITFRGSTSGSVPGESVELKFGRASPPTATLGLTDAKGYTVVVESVIYDLTGTLVASFMAKCAVRCAGGVATIAGTGTVEAFGDAALLASTLLFSVSANILHLTFTSGLGTAAVLDVVANMRITETN